MKTVDSLCAMIKTDRDAYVSLRATLNEAAAKLANIYEKNIQRTPADTVAAYISAVGYDLASVIIASLVNRCSWDGRISHSSNEWAKSVPDAYDEEATDLLRLSCDEIHRAHLDQIAHAMSRAQRPQIPA